jgi:hypothetical protein
MKIRNIITVVSMFITVSVLNLNAQVTGGGGSGGNGGIKTAIVVPDISFLTNHAELVGQVFKGVEGVMVNFYPAAATRSGGVSAFYAYTNSVKSLEDIMGLVTNNWWQMSVVDTNAPISLEVEFLNSSDESTVRGYNPQTSAQVLFEGYNGGIPQRNDYGQWVLPDWAEDVSMRINGSIFVTMTNVASVHMVVTNSSGGYQSSDLPISYGQGFWYQPDYAGNGILILGSYVYTTNNWVYYGEHAYDLANCLTEVPITPVLVRALLQDSDDFKTSVDQTNLSYTVYSADGYGKIPLLTPTYTRSMRVHLSLGDQLGNYASSFVIENQATGHRHTVSVPHDATGVNATMPEGVYHIIPLGLDLKSPLLYSGGYGYGKGL